MVSGTFQSLEDFLGFWGKESKEGELICLSAGYYHLYSYFSSEVQLSLRHL